MIDVSDLLFNDENDAKFARHRISPEDVQQVLDNRPRFYRNRPERRAAYVMIGPTFDDRLLVVPMEAIDAGLWRPVTAFEPTPQQASRYRSRK